MYALPSSRPQRYTRHTQHGLLSALTQYKVELYERAVYRPIMNVINNLMICGHLRYCSHDPNGTLNTVEDSMRNRRVYNLIDGLLRAQHD